MSLQGNGQHFYPDWLIDPVMKQPLELQDQAQAQLMAAWPTPSPSPGEQFPDLTQHNFARRLQVLPDAFAPACALQSSSSANVPMVRQQMPLNHMPMLRPPLPGRHTTLPVSNINPLGWTTTQPQHTQARAGMVQLGQCTRQASPPETALRTPPRPDLRMKQLTSATSTRAMTTPSGLTSQEQIQGRVDQGHNQRRAEAVVELRRNQQEQAQFAASVRRRDEEEAKALLKSQRHQGEKDRKRTMDIRRREKRLAYERSVEANRQQAITVAKEKQRLAQEQQALAQERQRLVKQQQILYNEQVERQRVLQEQKLEQERRLCRKEQLRKDPSSLYRHYDEYLEFFPLATGEYRSQYHNNLLANRRMPIEPDSDLGLAIQYAKDNWELFLQYPKDVEEATKWQKKKFGKIAMNQESNATVR